MNWRLTEMFTLFVIVALMLSFFLRLWLASRQERFVRANRHQVPSAFAEKISLSAHQRAADYALAKIRLGRLGLILETLLFLALTFLGGIQALHEFWAAHFQGLAYGLMLIASVMLISALLELPMEIYRQFCLEARFGFNRMNFRLFCSDLIKQLLIAILLGLPLLAAALQLMVVMGDAWWLYVWLLWAGFNLLALFIYPRFIAPLFNRFTPLPDGELKEQIRGLLRQGQFGERELFVMDGSRRSSHGNAYFVGFGKARRIVFFDTLLERLSNAQIIAVLAHELGHFHHRHILKRMAGIFALSLAFLALLGQLAKAPWFFEGLGLHQGNMPLALLLFSLTAPLFMFPLTPLLSALSRRHEFEADAYAACVSSPKDLSDALIRLYEDNAATLTPDPLYSLFYDSHPPASLRIVRLQEIGANPPKSA